jgi:hypothetical protein
VKGKLKNAIAPQLIQIAAKNFLDNYLLNEVEYGNSYIPPVLMNKNIEDIKVLMTQYLNKNLNSVSSQPYANEVFKQVFRKLFQISDNDDDNINMFNKYKDGFVNLNAQFEQRSNETKNILYYTDNRVLNPKLFDAKLRIDLKIPHYVDFVIAILNDADLKDANGKSLSAGFDFNSVFGLSGETIQIARKLPSTSREMFLKMLDIPKYNEAIIAQGKARAFAMLSNIYAKNNTGPMGSIMEIIEVDKYLKLTKGIDGKSIFEKIQNLVKLLNQIFNKYDLMKDCINKIQEYQGMNKLDVDSRAEAINKILTGDSIEKLTGYYGLPAGKCVQELKKNNFENVFDDVKKEAHEIEELISNVQVVKPSFFAKSDLKINETLKSNLSKLATRFNTDIIRLLTTPTEPCSFFRNNVINNPPKIAAIKGACDYSQTTSNIDAAVLGFIQNGLTVAKLYKGGQRGGDNFTDEAATFKTAAVAFKETLGKLKSENAEQIREAAKNFVWAAKQFISNSPYKNLNEKVENAKNYAFGLQSEPNNSRIFETINEVNDALSELEIILTATKLKVTIEQFKHAFEAELKKVKNPQVPNADNTNNLNKTIDNLKIIAENLNTKIKSSTDLKTNLEELINFKFEGNDTTDNNQVSSMVDNYNKLLDNVIKNLNEILVKSPVDENVTSQQPTALSTTNNAIVNGANNNTSYITPNQTHSTQPQLVHAATIVEANTTAEPIAASTPLGPFDGSPDQISKILEASKTISDTMTVPSEFEKFHTDFMKSIVIYDKASQKGGRRRKRHVRFTKKSKMVKRPSKKQLHRRKRTTLRKN